MEINAVMALLGATVVLVLVPGPNVFLIIANTIERGFRCGVITVLGTIVGVALQLAIIVIGLSALLEYAASTFVWLKWAGVLYLLYLGAISWKQISKELEESPTDEKPRTTVFCEGLLLAAVNPKTMLFNAAFLPQFVRVDAGPTSLLTTATIYLGVIFIGDIIWAASAYSARLFILKLGRLRHRLTGCIFFGSGIGLALAR